MIPILLFFQVAYAQTRTEPARFCSEILNGSFFTNCNLDTDFLRQSISPFVFISGGYFTLMFWAVITIVTYVKYKNAPLTAILGISIFSLVHLVIPPETYTAIYILTVFTMAAGIMILIWRIPRD